MKLRTLLVLSALALLLLTGSCVFGPSIEQLNQRAKPGESYAGTEALRDALGAAGFTCRAFKKEPPMVNDSADCATEVDGKTTVLIMNVYTKGQVDSGVMTFTVNTYLKERKKIGPGGILLVGPNWTLAADAESLKKVQEELGGKLKQ